MFDVMLVNENIDCPDSIDPAFVVNVPVKLLAFKVPGTAITPVKRFADVDLVMTP